MSKKTKKNVKKNYQFGVRHQITTENRVFDNPFANTSVYQKYISAPFMMSHEIAHKKVIDHFFPNDPAEIYEVNGRPMTGNMTMKNHDLNDVINDMNYFENYKKILIAGYVQEVIDLGLEQYFEQIFEAQIKNVRICVAMLNELGDAALWHGCFTNDDGKFYYLCKKVGMSFKEIVDEWMNAANWCKNFLKAA